MERRCSLILYCTGEFCVCEVRVPYDLIGKHFRNMQLFSFICRGYFIVCSAKVCVFFCI